MNNLKRLLLEKHISQQELAEYCKISIGSVQSFCQKKRSIESCRINTLLKIAECLECKITDLFDDDILSKKIEENIMCSPVQNGSLNRALIKLS